MVRSLTVPPPLSGVRHSSQIAIEDDSEGVAWAITARAES